MFVFIHNECQTCEMEEFTLNSVSVRPKTRAEPVLRDVLAPRPLHLPVDAPACAVSWVGVLAVGIDGLGEVLAPAHVYARR